MIHASLFFAPVERAFNSQKMRLKDKDELRMTIKYNKDNNLIIKMKKK